MHKTDIFYKIISELGVYLNCWKRVTVNCDHLSASASKTKAMVISTKKNSYSDMQLYLDNQVIERVSSAKLLGILISDSLSWSLYIDHICKKARRIIGFIRRAFSSAPICTRRILYLVIVRPIMAWNTGVSHGIP